MNRPLQTTLILTPEDVQYIIQHIGADQLMDQLIARLEQAFLKFDPAQTDIPIRSGFNYEKPYPGLIEWMPLYQASDQIVIKVVGYHPENPNRLALPTIVSTISAYDSTNGHLIGLADGVLLTALRTGAASAVATRHLAKPESTSLGLIGCGAQAITQLHAISRVRNIKEVRFYDADAQTMANFAERCTALQLNCQFIPTSLKAVVEQSDVICTATSIDVGEGPLFDDLPTLPHLHVNAVGSDFPGKIELPKSLLEQSFICPDFIEQALKEGECQQLSRAEIDTDIIEFIKQKDTGPAVQDKRTIFDSTGWALEDQVVMNLFMEYANELGRGQEIAIESLQEDAKNPYHFMSEVAVKTY
ncbi:MAG: ornithine cyclodeaminase family protein [Saprospiraceae bacterium]|nr:ornithine cyclodeaminase family protein [Saprospiraceae bacterium]